jgi:glutaredoxin-related protein
MKVTAATLMLNIENKIEVGPLKLNVIHQVCFYEGKNGEIACDVEFMDQTDVTYMGVPISTGYDNWKKFTNFHKEMGIDFDKLIDEESAKIVNDSTACELVDEYRYKKLYQVFNVCNEGC